MKLSAVPALIALIALAASPVLADKYQEKCPCGPDSFKGPFRLLLVAGQGHRGADFRPACVTHDVCYDTPGEPKEKCDDQFLCDLLLACESSKAPRIARLKARLSYWLVKNWGGSAYDSAQQIAYEKAALSGK